jgi:starch synthase
LNQIYSLKYGTVPIVRATGGLDDTVEPFDDRAKSNGTGFKFAEYSAAALLATLQKALEVYHRRDAWSRLMQNGMSRDFSWRNSAKQYAAIYQRLRQEKAITHTPSS